MTDLLDNLTYEGGLIPVIVQDTSTKAVLMFAYANQEAVMLTKETGFAHYYSRSRQKLWKKGEESGHLQKVCEIRVDCDPDCLLYLVEQTGCACHEGYFS
ncbi:MAG TPA: phosphoribosyl-AMP cyclohydrolase, partial [Methanocorpusculum sp.]|nr:phosphoribosyl-AMP cyclohydrolase [Methanocorpusculum sp.]